ncbi:GNAT family N-acetyltransferase [Rhizohabitans arisaemae]|uniref:GNAT family N-acetyltransferase n=1 Tax=Rhizohabitans arisaemae TaxID=2720610 RepID=UPI0024B0D2B9|nr:GNAT family N-acetyltransferase [Rhizohabitans arisaemae]
MRVSVVRPAELGSAEVAAWRKIQGAVPHLDNPFLSPEFTIAAGEVLPHARVAVLSAGADICGFFPFERGKFGVGTAIAGWVSLGQGIVARPEALPELDLRVLLREAGLDVFEFGLLVGGQPWFAPHTTRTMDSFVMDVGDGYDAYLAALRNSAPKVVKNTRYTERRLARDAGPVGFDPEVSDESLLRRVLGWKSDQYRRMGRADRFERPWVAELVRRLHHGPLGALCVLHADGRPIAGHFGLRTATSLISWFPAYDPEYGRYSPGLIQHLKMAEASAAAGIRRLDLGPGENYLYKRQLHTATVTVGEGCVRRHSPGGTLHALRRVPANAARRLILDTPLLYGAADRALRGYSGLRAKLGRR